MINLPGAPNFTRFLNESYGEKIYVFTNGRFDEPEELDVDKKVFGWDIWLKSESDLIRKKIGRYQTASLIHGRDNFERLDYPRSYEGLIPCFRKEGIHLLWLNQILAPKIQKGALIPSSANVSYRRMDEFPEIPFP